LIRHDAADIGLDSGEVEPGTALPGGGHGGGSEPKRDSLDEIIAAINERWGTDLDERDRLEVEKVEVTLQSDEELRTFANANTLDNFALEFSPKFKSAILDTESHTQRLYELLLTNPELAKMIEAEVMRSTYDLMRGTPD
jgi:type I restriction enzyme R subunit